MNHRQALRRWGLPGLLVAAGIIAYWNAMGTAFVFDDIRGIVDRTDDFTMAPWQLIVGERRPLVTLTLAANHFLGGLDTRGYQAFNIAVHIATGLALFALVRRSAERLTAASDGTCIAFVVSLLWIVHPLGTASVTYIIQRAEAMAALCMVLVLLAVFNAARSPRSMVWAFVAITLCMLGMMSKATMIAAPLLAFLFDGLVVSNSLREAWKRRWGLHVALAATCLLVVPTGLAAAIFHAVPDPEAGVGLSVTSMAPLEYLRTQPGVVVHYVSQALWPATLCIDPDWPVAHTARAIVGPAVVIGAGIVATFVAVCRRHPLAFPMVSFFVLLAPTSSVVPIRDLVAEHRMYLPLAALIVLIVSIVRFVLRITPGLRTAPVGIGLLAVVTIALIVRTVERNRDYATPVALWSATVEAAPHNHRAWMNLGVALRAEGRNSEAIDAIAKALDIQSNDPVAQLNLGAALLDEGRHHEAAAILRVAAIRLRDRPRAWLLLGDADRALGHVEDALDAYRRAYAVRPEPAIRLRVGNLLSEVGRLDEAAEEFHAVADSATEDVLRASALFNLGNTRYRQDDFARAIEAYRGALAADPDHAGARHWLAEAGRRHTPP